MKKLLFCAQFVLFVAFNFFLFLTIVEITDSRSFFSKFDHETPFYNGKEDFDPSLSRLSDISSLENYCDSIYNLKYSSDNSLSFEAEYPRIASAVVRKKFFHGYSSYGYSNNHMALMLEPLTGIWVSAIVIPDDIMKYPYAACSQQSIVTMALLKRKNFKTRMVGFDGGKKFGGHFCFEAYYNNSWHFFDPNQEPNDALLASYDRPSIEYLLEHNEILVSAYNHWAPERLLGMFNNYFYGKPNRFEAPNALVYQHITKFLSYTTWMFLLLAFLAVRKRYLRLLTPYYYNVRNRGFFIPSITGERSISYYSKTRA
ncbi:MAG: hypothetical protein H7Y42_06795 [Chitinophagaceae bacterium]|nr:hypothetical protein [Chitinophagaceae bacterium]